MRIERISENQFTIFLTFEDLVDRGFTKNDLWHDALSVQNLFSDMMYEASSEIGFELEGMLLVQVHLMQAQGMHIVVTQNSEHFDVEDMDDDFIEMKVTLDESDELIFGFESFENVIQLTAYLSAVEMTGGQVYYMNEQYYMLIDETELNDKSKEDIIAIMSEFAQPSIMTSHRLKEYGKCIFSKDAVKQIDAYFFK